MAFKHLNTNSAKLVHYKLKIRKVIEFFLLSVLDATCPFVKRKSQSLIFRRGETEGRKIETLAAPRYGCIGKYDVKQLIFSTLQPTFIKPYIKVAVGPTPWTNRNLKQIITTDYTKTAILQLLLPLDISKLVERQLTRQSIIEWIYF